VAGAIEDGKLGIWTLADGRERRTLVHAALPAKGEYFDAALSRDGRLLAAAVTDGFVVWDLATGAEVAFLPAPGREHRVLFEPSGSLLTLTNGAPGLSRRPISVEPGPGGRIRVGVAEPLPLPPGSHLACSRDGTVIVSGSRAVSDQERYAGGWIWRLDRPGQPICVDPGADVMVVTVSPDGNWLATVTLDTGITKIWDARDGRFLKKLEGPYGGPPCFSPDGKWLRAGIDGGHLLAVGTWEQGPPISPDAVFAPEGPLVAVPAAGVCRLVDRGTNRQVALLEDPDLDLAISTFFTPDGTKLIALTRNKGVHVWDLRLIRRGLKEMGLDWDWPEFPPEAAPALPAAAAPAIP
jgi:WD40 repeat protein